MCIRCNPFSVIKFNGYQESTRVAFYLHNNKVQLAITYDEQPYETRIIKHVTRQADTFKTILTETVDQC